MLKGSVRLLWNHNRRGGDYGSTDRLSDSLLPFPSNVHLPAAIRQWGNALFSRWSRCHVKRYIFGHGVGGRKAFAIGCHLECSLTYSRCPTIADIARIVQGDRPPCLIRQKQCAKIAQFSRPTCVSRSIRLPAAYCRPYCPDRAVQLLLSPNKISTEPFGQTLRWRKK